MKQTFDTGTFTVSWNEKSKIRVGDNLVFKRSGLLANILSLLVKMFYPKWDRWGWHMAVVAWYDNSKRDWMILEATGQGVVLTPLSVLIGKSGMPRIYHWNKVRINKDKVKAFVDTHLGQRYDVLLYFWTFAQYLFRHFWNKPIPRLLDYRWTCWELATEFDEFMGKPIVSKFDCPVIADLVKKLEDG